MEAGVQSTRADEKIPYLIDRWGICQTWEIHTHTHEESMGKGAGERQMQKTVLTPL